MKISEKTQYKLIISRQELKLIYVGMKEVKASMHFQSNIDGVNEIIAKIEEVLKNE